jgi:hypothetical protein
MMTSIPDFQHFQSLKVLYSVALAVETAHKRTGSMTCPTPAQ